MQAEILLTLRLQQKLFADPRRIALLKQIEQTGSISQGAKNAGISYKSAWDASAISQEVSGIGITTSMSRSSHSRAIFSPSFVPMLTRAL